MYDFTRPAEGLNALHEMAQVFALPVNIAAQVTHALFDHPVSRIFNPAAGHIAGAAALTERVTRQYKKQPFDIDGAQEEVAMSLSFCDLRRFRTQGADAKPKILLVAPMSGHHATLLRETVQGLVQDHDVYITDWHDARHIPLSAGHFTLDTYITYVQKMIRHFHGDVHVMGICQPGVPVLAAVSLMEATNDPYAPKSMILMGSPIDTRINPTAVNDLATGKGYQWFENVIAHVGPMYPGAGRRVYPGVLQLSGFMSMNLKRHEKAHHDLFNAIARGDREAIAKFDRFYDEYKAVADLPAEYYLPTIKTVFIEHHLPRGIMMHQDEQNRLHRVNPAAISRVALMTVEGSKDDITGLGQTLAAQDQCTGLRPGQRKHLLQEGVGHYGLFSGSKWHGQILPAVTQFVLLHDGEVRERVTRPRCVPA
jgi:poly(3-hydroxybutyrate) depolymerase